jgi:hypothetical protein
MTATPSPASGDSTPAIVHDHLFMPGSKGWWSLCNASRYDGDRYLGQCHLAESAHARTTVTDEQRR